MESYVRTILVKTERRVFQAVFREAYYSYLKVGPMFYVYICHRYAVYDPSLCRTVL